MNKHNNSIALKNVFFYKYYVTNLKYRWNIPTVERGYHSGTFQMRLFGEKNYNGNNMKEPEIIYRNEMHYTL